MPRDDVVLTRSGLLIPTQELEMSSLRASGPGGQHVNSTDTAVQLRFDITASTALSDGQRQRLLATADRRISGNGVIVIKAARFRSQARNREDAIHRLVAFLDRGLAVQKKRKATKPGTAARARRREDKRRRSRLKATRRPPDP